MLLKDIIEKFDSLSDEEKETALSAEYKTPDEIQGLLNKRDELIVKTKKLSKRVIDEDKKELLEYLDSREISTKDDLDEFFSSTEETKTKTTKESEKYKRLLEKQKNEALKIKEDLNRERSIRLNAEKTNVLNRELGKYELSNGSKDILLDYFSNKAQVDIEDDGSLNVISKEDGLSSIADVISDWSKTDQAKSFLKAPVNAGAGTTQSDTSSSQEKMTLQDIAKVSDPAERKALYEKHGY